MRSLTSSRPSSARHRDDRDEGAVMVMLALMLTVLIGVGALTIDLGALYVERRQLQNGADAAALAVAQDCAGGDCQLSAGLAQRMANDNAGRDGMAAVDRVCGSGPGLSPCAGESPSVPDGALGWVGVDTSTRTASGNEIDFVMAPIMNSAAGSTVHASAIVAWGAPGRATIAPLIISQCEYQEAGGFIPEDGEAATLPNLPVTAYFHTSTSASRCPAGPSGADAPGGFGWLASSSSCLATVSADSWVGVSTGVAPPNGCNPTAWRNQTLLIAIFDGTNSMTGNNLQYHLLGFAAIVVRGYAFTRDFWSADPSKRNARQLCPDAPGNSAICLVGEFVGFVTVGAAFGGPDLGVRVIKMIG